MFGGHVEEVGEDWIKLHSEVPRGVLGSPNIIRMIKPEMER
jgi:hypothetical protein